MNCFQTKKVHEPSAEQSADFVIKEIGSNIENPTLFKGLEVMKTEHHIKLNVNATPVVHPPRKILMGLRDHLKKELDSMENTGVIKKVDEPTEWVNSLVVGEKPNGDLRICLDPRDLNKAIKREYYQLPTFEEISSRLSGAKVFTKLDANKGYWQIPLDEESIKKISIQQITVWNTFSPRSFS